MKANRLISTMLVVMLYLSGIIQQAQAQQPGSAANKTCGSAEVVGLADSLTLVPRGRRSGFSLMSSSTRAGTSGSGAAITAAAASPPAVLGNGTVGRISIWAGTSPSGNSILGDSIITQLNGNIGIGTTTPASKLTVKGMIETTLGGYKFPDGTVQTTAAVSGLSFVVRDSTLIGNGTSGSPLGVAVPLNLTGAVPRVDLSAVIKVTNTAESGNGVTAIGGHGSSDSSSSGGAGLVGIGGDGFFAGTGLIANGGASNSFGGTGLTAVGGSGNIGGDGIRALGADSRGDTSIGSAGIIASGGRSGDRTTEGPAGRFLGHVEISGALNVSGTKNFKIDHPLDPENKYLIHAAIESAEVLNVYSGNVMTNEQGEATVTLPDWFEALNRDFRYQLTVVGTFAQAIVADEIQNNRFKIKTNAAGVKVSWQVTGVRSDAHMQKHAFKVEENKPEHERGTYLSPEAFNQPEERGVEWARHPELMRRMKETREQMKQKAHANKQ